MNTGSATTDPLWSPTAESLGRSNIRRFEGFLRERHGLEFRDYDELWRWSVTDLEGFWGAIWEFFGLGDSTAYDAVLGRSTMPGAEWFPGAQLNFAECLLAAGSAEDVAIVTLDERGGTEELTRDELRREVASLSRVLSDAGVGPGDAVVGYLPNIAEAVVAFLASAALGAVWSSVGQDYGASAALDRFAQLKPKALVAADGYLFNGREHDRTDAVRAICAGLPSVECTILVSRLGTGTGDAGWSPWSEAIAGPAGPPVRRFPFDQPLWVLFSSGTTGVPKGMVHGHGGVMLEMLKQLSLHWDLHDDDRLFWYTSPSWVMWNIQLSALALGSSIVCYDGAPGRPVPSAMWKAVSSLAVTFFGTSPGYLQSCEAAGARPATDFDLTSLRAVGVTGSPLSPHLHRWATEELKGLPVYSMSGGTDVAGSFCGGASTVPVWPGELSARALGVALEAWDEQGRPVTDEVGELVVTRPLPSMPLRFWDDPDGAKYTDAYFAVYPGVWRHGDWITLTQRGSVVVHGRSDATLNRHGVRMGSADIYAVVDSVTEVVESLVVGAEMPDGGYWMPLFVVLGEGLVLDDALKARIGGAIRSGASPRHVPDDIIQVSAIPHTRTGKKLEIPIKRLLQGVPLARVAAPGAVDDAEALAQFATIAAARSEGQAARGVNTHG